MIDWLKGQALPPLPRARMPRNSSLVLRAVQEVLLVGRTLIGIARRNGDAVQPELLHLVEEGGDLARDRRR